MVGERAPAVFHIASRQIFSFAGALNCDHSDIYNARTTNIAMLSSNSVQEVADNAFIAHWAAVKGQHPFLHFYDGLRTSHEFHKIDLLEPEVVRENFPVAEAEEWRYKSAIKNNDPTISGSGCNNDLWWQICEAQMPDRRNLPNVVEQGMDVLYNITGRRYHLFNYYGHPEAEHIIVMMGSGASTAQEVVEFLASKGERVGLVAVHLFRPFSVEHLLKVVPKTVKRVCVLDKAKENAAADPLCLDVQMAFSKAADDGLIERPMVVGGEYGICGWEFQPKHVLAVLENLKTEKPRTRFIVGPIDDVSNTSLDLPKQIPVTLPQGTTECIFWSLGGDGTIGANRAACDIIGTNTDFYSQAYFAFSPKKTGGEAVSFLRFGPSPIQSTYECTSANYIAVHKAALLHAFPNMLAPIREGGVFVLNCPWKTSAELALNVPAHHLKMLAEKKAKVYTIDATMVAEQVGLRGRVNNVLQSVFSNFLKFSPLSKLCLF
ncbi:hypothetical protein GEMRC1_000269 [Eukaryota sp. GEM-RC1]